jgi:hypothetical protein
MFPLLTHGGQASGHAKNFLIVDINNTISPNRSTILI